MKTMYLVCAAICSSAVQTHAAPEQIQLFAKPNFSLTGCDQGTLMTLDYAKKTLKLEDNIVGFCMMSVNPNIRSYTLKISQAPAVITSVGTGIENASRLINVDDYRHSVMPIPHQSLVEVKEKDGAVKTFYSQQ